jgi:hypothetical protein
MIAPSGDPLPEPLAQRLHAELQPGETLLWTGRPIPAAAARGIWIFSLVGGVMMIPALIMAAVMGLIVLIVALLAKSLCVVLFLLPLFAMLCLMIVLLLALPLYVQRQARHTVYALTDRRAIVWQKGFGAMRVRSFNRDQLAALQRTERPDGTGDLIFEQTLYHGHHGHHHTQSVGFTSIARVRDVEELIRATLLTPPQNNA